CLFLLAPASRIEPALLRSLPTTPATTRIYTLSLHDALPISHQRAARRVRGRHERVRHLPPFRSDTGSVRGAGARGDRGRPGTGRGGVAVLRGHRPRERCHRVHRQLRGVRGAQAALRGELEWRIVRAAVLGSPVAHSLSPVLHTAAYRALGMEGWSYGLYECT